MTYGLRVWDAAGVLTFDSTTAEGGCLADSFTVGQAAGSSSRSYPDFAGRSAFLVTNMFGAGAVLDFALGYPRVTTQGVGYEGYVLVFIT